MRCSCLCLFLRTATISHHRLDLTWSRPPSSPPARWDAARRFPLLTCAGILLKAQKPSRGHAASTKYVASTGPQLCFVVVCLPFRERSQGWGLSLSYPCGKVCVCVCVCVYIIFFLLTLLQGSCFGSDEIKAIILRFLQQWVSCHTGAGLPTCYNITLIRVLLLSFYTHTPVCLIPCVPGITAYMTLGTDSPFWTPTTMAPPYLSWHRFLLKTFPGTKSNDTHASIQTKRIFE